MNKTANACVIGVLLLIHCLLALLYCTNQIPGKEGLDILTNTYSIHYSEGMFDFSHDTLTTLVTTMPMRLLENLFSPALSVLITRLASFFILYTALKSLLHRNTMLWFSAIYLLAPWLLYTTNLTYTSFLELGVACYFLSVVKMNYYNQIDNNSTGQSFWFFLHITSICWCAHFHYAWIILLLASLILIARNIIRVRLWGLIGSICVCGILLLPIFVEPNKLPISYDTILDNTNYGYGITHVYPILKSLLYWLRFGSTLGSNDMLFSTNFEWMTNNDDLNQMIRSIWIIAVYIVGTVSLSLNIASNYLLIRNTRKSIFKRTDPESSSELLSILAMAVLGGTIIFAALAPHLLSSNELIICLDFALLPILLYIDKFYKLAYSYHVSMVCVMAVFLLFLNAFPAISSENYSPDGEFMEQASDINNNQFN